MSLILGACSEKLINKEKIFVGAKPEELIVIVDYFDKFPLISQKWAIFIYLRKPFLVPYFPFHFSEEGNREIGNRYGRSLQIKKNILIISLKKLF